MSIYTGPKCRLCRAALVKLFLKGDKCESPKCPVVRRQSVPGQRRRSRGKNSDYALHLKEKQKAKRIYMLGERQFRNYFKQALRKIGNTGENLLGLVERRLDNVVTRGGLAFSRRQARQLLLHGHFRLNGKVVFSPSLLVDVGDEVTFGAERSVREVVIPSWLEIDHRGRSLKVVSRPGRQEITEAIDEQLLVEFYSR